MQIVDNKIEFDAAPKVDHINNYKRGGGNIQVRLLQK